MWKSVITTVLVIYVCVGAVLALMQRRFVYFPNTERPTLSEYDLRGDFSVVSAAAEDGPVVESWYATPKDETMPVFVFFHGNAGHVGHRVEKVVPYLDAGYGVLLVGYRGYGGNSGSPDEEGLYSDGRAALDWLAREGIAGDRLVLYGESIGSAVAVQMAAERAGQALALVLEAPFSSAVDVGQSRFPIFPVRWLMRDRFDSVAKISTIAMPLFVIHGERDSIVPLRFGKKLFDAAVDPKSALWLPEADHNDLYDYGAAGAVLAFLDRSRIR